jgi:hypothetical protein
MKGRHLDDASRWLVDLRRRKGRILEWKASRDYRLLKANLRGLLQRVSEGHFKPSTTSNEANDWSHRLRTSSFRSRTCLRFAQPRGDRSMSNWPIRSQRLHHRSKVCRTSCRQPAQPVCLKEKCIWLAR